MKKIGIIGGLAWPSTADYYRFLCTKTTEHFRRAGSPAPYPTPHMVIESLDMSETRKLRGREGDDASWENYEGLFRATFERLRQAGAGFGLIASNTPHMRLKGITRGLDFPVLSILDTTAAAVRALNSRRALVLGTPVTMRSPVYADALKKLGIATVGGIPDENIAEIEKLIEALYEEKIEDTPTRILKVARAHIDDSASDVVCLACTELPLAFPEYRDAAWFRIEGITFVNTTVAHAEAAIQESIGLASGFLDRTPPA